MVFVLGRVVDERNQKDVLLPVASEVLLAAVAGWLGRGRGVASANPRVFLPRNALASGTKRLEAGFPVLDVSDIGLFPWPICALHVFTCVYIYIYIYIQIYR